MAKSKLRVSQVLGMASARGVYTDRETIGVISDVLLGDVKVNGRRVWTAEQAEVIAIALELMRKRGLTLDEVSQVIRDRSAAAAAVDEFRDMIERAGTLVGAA